jgi:hypothetical protein
MNRALRPDPEKQSGVSRGRRTAVLGVLAFVGAVTLAFRAKSCRGLEDKHDKTSGITRNLTTPTAKGYAPKKPHVPIPRIAPSYENSGNEPADSGQKSISPHSAAETPICKTDYIGAFGDKKTLCLNTLQYADEFLAKAKISDDCEDIAGKLQAATNNLIRCTPLMFSHSDDAEIRDTLAYIEKIRSDRVEVRNRARNELKCKNLPPEDQQDWEKENIWCGSYGDDAAGNKKYAFMNTLCRYHQARGRGIEEAALRSGRCEDIKKTQEFLRLARLVCAPVILDSSSSDRGLEADKLEAEQSDIDSRIDNLELLKPKDCD